MIGCGLKPPGDYKLVIIKDDLQTHIEKVNQAIHSNGDRKEKNQLIEYCFECALPRKKQKWIGQWCWHRHVYYGNLVVLRNMMIYFMRLNRNRKTLKNKFGRTKNLPHGFDPDFQDRMLDKAVKDENYEKW